MPVVWKSVTPSSIQANQVYDIQDWLCLFPNKQLSTDRTVPEEVKDKIVKLVKPLQSLYFNSTSRDWHYKENCKLNVSDQTITQGFISDMSNSRGRGMVQRLISELFSSESSMKVVNIGGNSTSKEPGVRSLLFKIFEESENDSWCSYKFVPDIVLESTSKEHLVVEVKKGRIFHQEDISQLRYMLMPAALHQETAVGVLICAKQAVLEKCIATNGEVNFQRSVYEFGKDSLVAGMENLLKDIYCNFVQ